LNEKEDSNNTVIDITDIIIKKQLEGISNFDIHIEMINKMLETEIKAYEIHKRRLKIVFITMFVFLGSMILTGLSVVFYPELIPFANIYLIICNIGAILINGWNIFNVLKFRQFRRMGIYIVILSILGMGSGILGIVSLL